MLQDRRRGGWRVAVAVAVVAALAVALVVVSRRADAPSPPAGSVAGATAAPAASAPAPGDTAPRADTVVEDLGDALAAWGEFAVSGDLTMLDPAFAAAGPQRAQLATEAAAIAADPPGPPPYVFEATEYGEVTVENGAAEVGASFRLSRDGEEAAIFEWRIVLRWDAASARWQLWTVVAVEG